MANQTVYGIAKDRNHANKVVQILIDAGIPKSDISFLASNMNQSQESQGYQQRGQGTTSGANRNWRTEERLTDYPSGSSDPGFSRHTESRDWETPSTSTTQAGDWETRESGQSNRGDLGVEKHTKAPEGATTGVTTGGLIGGVLGLLAGIGTLAIPGLGPFIAAGPIMSTLAGMGAGGALGEILGAIIGSTIPEHEVKRYGNMIQEGGVLLAIQTHSDDSANHIKDILRNNQVQDISVSSNAITSKNSKNRS